MQPHGSSLPDVDYQVRSPKTKEEWQSYYHLRWEILRKPWQQPKGSEKDELEYSAFHCMITDEHNRAIAVGRIHELDDISAQIRYMAVASEYERLGLGSQILNVLEQAATNSKKHFIFLHAREHAVTFYKKHGYKIDKPSHLLYGEVQHYLMKKEL